MKANSIKTKEHILRFRAVNRDTFLDIKKGKKKVETRAATPRYRKIEAGDTLVFACGKERFKKKVVAVKLFKSIPALFRVYPMKITMPRLKTIKEVRDIYDSFPGYKEKLKKFGLIAFKIK